MELYIHIPFCKSKCQYCDFVSFMNCDEAILEYSNALNKEIKFASEKFKDRIIDTVYIGGGTPSYLPENIIGNILSTLNLYFDLSKVKEFTIECNPESITESKLILYKQYGINRLSIGVQSLNDQNLKEIGRIHDTKTAIEKIKLASKYFLNLSCDLIIGLPYDTKDSIRDEINILSKYISHISMYELIVEEGTKLYDRVKMNDINLPSDDDVVDLFNVAISAAKENELYRYEVSNFAKNELFSKHNYGYWIREEYLGLGLNAASLIKNGKEYRFSNLKVLDDYILNLNEAVSYDDIKKVETEELSNKDIVSETIMLGLRTTKGIKIDLLPNEIIKKYKKYFDEKDDYIALNDEGMSIMNTILIDVLK